MNGPETSGCTERFSGRFSEPSAFVRPPLLAPLLVLSLILHGAVIGLWPNPTFSLAESLPAGPIALQLQLSAHGGPPAATPETVAQMRPEAVHATKPDDRRAEKAPPRPGSRPSEIIRPSRKAPHALAEPTDSDDVSAPPSTTPPQASAAAAPTNDAVLRTQLRNRLHHALIAHFEYPLAARRRGWEGVVHIGLRVESDGKLSGLRLTGSSGYALLDHAALKSLGRVGRLPDVASSLEGRQFDMVVPVRYQLIDS